MTTYNSLGLGRTIGAGVNNLSASDFQISVNSTNGAVTINLPSISSILDERRVSGYLQVIQYLIADISGTAGTNKITLIASSGETINGGASVDLDINNISAVLVPTSHNTWALTTSIGAPDVDAIPYGNDFGGVNTYKVNIPDSTLTAGYTFEMRILAGNTNTGASTLNVSSTSIIPLVDSDLNPLTAGMVEGDSIYLIAYNLEANVYQLLGLAKPNVSITDVTYAQLVALMGLANLAVGAKYRITDFQTVNIIPNTAVVNIAVIVEPLIVQATSIATISANAQSTLFPQDELLYEVFDTTTSGGTFGRIYYRKDTINNNSTYYDWRNVKFRRWADAFGQFTSVTPTAFAFIDTYTFNSSSSALDCYNNSLGVVAHDNPLGLTDGLNNTLLRCEAENNFFDFNCINNTIQGGAFVSPPPCYNNNVGANFYGNTFGATLSIPSEAMQGNTIGAFFHDNTSQTFVDNNIGDKFTGNTLTFRLDRCIIKIPVASITFPAVNLADKILEFGNSTFEATKNNLASATIALTGYETICGIINLTHTAGALTITNISGSTGNSPIEFRIASGKVTTFTSASAPTAVATEIVLPTTNFVATGANFDYLKVVNRSSVLFQTEAINYFV